MYWKSPIINLKPKAYKNNSSNDPHGSQVSIEINETSVQKPSSKNEDQTDMPNFSVSPESLAELVDIKELGSNDQSNRIRQIASALETNIDTGIIGDEKDLHRRIKAFGSNKDLEGHPNPLDKSLIQLLLEAFKNSKIILLLCCATLSLIIDIKMNGPGKGFFDGAIIFLAIFIVVNFSNTCRFFKSKIDLKRLQKQKRFSCVVREGKLLNIPASEVVVGDIVFLQTGTQVPADGLIIDGDSCKLDDGLMERGFKYSSMFSGAKVMEGNCRMLVTSVGENIERIKLIRLIGNERKHKESKLQNDIDKMNSRFENLWLTLSLNILILQVFRCFLSKAACDESQNPNPKDVKNTAEEIMNEAMKIMKKQASGSINGLVGMLCILLAAARDGLPLGIFVILFFASKKMKSLDAVVARLSACATLGLVTTVCLSKTDDLILNPAEMAELWIGINCIKDVLKEVNGEVLKKLREGVHTDSSGGLIEDYSLICWAQHVLGVQVNGPLCRKSVDFDKIDGKLLVLRRIKETKDVLEMHWRGDPEFILSQCSHYYDADGTMQTIDEEKKAIFCSLINEELVSDNLPCLAFGYKKIVREESTSSKPEEKGNPDDDDDSEKILAINPAGLTLIGFVRLKNPYSTGIRQGIEACQSIGVNIKLMVDDNIKEARIMALHSGIFRPEDDLEVNVIDGKNFRKSSEEARMKMIDKINVISKPSLADKLLMVQCLRKKGGVVATTGSCIRDIPSLMEADVGIFMGENSAGMAKENADIISISGLNILTVAAILRMGRYVCQCIKKFLELHLTLNMSAFMVNLIFQATMSEVQISSIQLLWTNLIFEAAGAFALAILVIEMESANPQIGQIPGESMRVPPPVYGAGGTIVTKTMCRNIVIQSFTQVAILVVLVLKGKHIFRADDDVLKTMIFNSYVMCQVFLMIGAMKIKKSNISQVRFSIDNLLFLVVLGMIVALQVLLIEIMGVVAHWGKLDNKRWWICVSIAALSSPLGYVAKGFQTWHYHASDLVSCIHIYIK